MIVDEQRCALHQFGGMTREVNLADKMTRNGVEPGVCIVATIGAGNMHIVDVDQKAATAPIGQRDQKFGLAHLRPLDIDIDRGVFDEDGAAENFLCLVDMRDHDVERFLRQRHRQKVVEMRLAVACPCEMLGHEPGLVARHQRLQAQRMRPVERTGGPERQADAVQRQRVVFADGGEIAMRRSARPHVVLGMDLEPAECRPAIENLEIMLWLEPDPGRSRDRGRSTPGGRAV